MVFGNSPVEKTSSFESFEALLSDDGREVERHVVPMIPHILIGEEIHVVKSRRELIKNFVHVYLRSHKHEPINTEIKAHLECQGRSGAISLIKSSMST